MGSEFGSENRDIKVDRKHDDLSIGMKSDTNININGRLIEKDGDRVIVDGRIFPGTYQEAIKACAAMPARWSGLFD